MHSCPHCGRSVADNTSPCPNCCVSRESVWPPPVAAAPTVAPVRLLTGNRGGDITLGILTGVTAPFVLQIVSILFLRLLILVHPAPAGFGLLGRCGPSLVAILGLYFWMRLRYPVLARSLGWTFLGEIALALGAMVLYFYALTHSQ